MNIIEERRTEVRVGETTFSVKIAVMADEADGLTRRRVAVDLSALGEGNECVADGKFEVNVDAITALSAVLSDTLRQRSIVGDKNTSRAKRVAPRQGQPWTDELDAELEVRWLTGESVEAVAAYFERTPGSIRARLPRVGCDPERPGEYLPQPPSQRKPEEQVPRLSNIAS